MCIWSRVNSWNIFIFASNQAFIYTHFWDSCKYYANTWFLLSAFCRYPQLHSQSLELWPASSHLPFFFEGKKPPHANSNLNSKVFQGLKSHVTFLHWNSMLRTNASPANRETFYHVSVATHQNSVWAAIIYACLLPVSSASWAVITCWAVKWMYSSGICCHPALGDLQYWCPVQRISTFTGAP